MPAIIKKGINYSMGSSDGEGNDNSEIISYEDYQNLSDEEKNSDTTYYIPDYPDEEGGTVEVVDSLDSTDTDKALSANMGRELNECLTAPNGTQFRFSYNEESGKYGYLVADSEGADTFVPFSSSDTQKLYEALQYSGLVTEDMTFDEMCNVLSNEYPPQLTLYENGNVNSTITGGFVQDGTFDAFSTNSNGCLYGKRTNRANTGGNVLTSKSIDVSRYKKIHFVVQSASVLNTYGRVYLYYGNSSVIINEGGASVANKTYSFDLSTLTSIKVGFSIYAGASANQGGQINISKIWLE